jgi:thioredoxin 1
MSIPLVSEAEFASKTAKGRVLVDFFAEWCGPCKRLTPILEELAPQMEGRCSFIKINIDECGSICQKFEVTSVPTLVLLEDGKEIKRSVGLRDAATIKTLIEG